MTKNFPSGSSLIEAGILPDLTLLSDSQASEQLPKHACQRTIAETALMSADLTAPQQHPNVVPPSLCDAVATSLGNAADDLVHALLEKLSDSYGLGNVSRMLSELP